MNSSANASTVRKLGPNFQNRTSVSEASPVGDVTIGMVGKYTELPDAYTSVNEALKHTQV